MEAATRLALDGDVLLMTTKSGGYGLNLEAADVVVMMDHSWNPKEDEQAMNRAHRLTQTKVVNVFRLIATDTIEEHIMNVQKFKDKVTNAVVTNQNSAAILPSL